MRWRFGRVVLSVATIVALFGAAIAAAEPAVRNRSGRERSMAAQIESVDMFPAMREGKITVKLVAKDSTEAKLLVTNKTNVPLDVKLPASFAAVHVLAQLGGPGGGGAFAGMFGQGQQGNQAGSAQSLGMGQQQNNPGGNAIGMNCIPPERVGEVKLKAVCLDYGKPDPRQALTYDVRPFEEVTSQPGVAEVCTLMAQGKITRRVAQAAAWHLNNDLSWDQVEKIKVNPILAESYSYFEPNEIKAGKAAAEQALKQAEANKTKTWISPGEVATRENAANK